MYPSLNRLTLYDRNTEATQDSDYEIVDYRSLEVSLNELRQTVLQNVNFFEMREYKLLEKFLEDEQQYVDKLTVLEVQKYDLQQIGIPQYDLECLFGHFEEIKKLHECVFPRDLIRLTHLGDLFHVFVTQGHKLRIYIMDQWRKSEPKFSGKQALLKRFQSKNVISILSLPEQRISQYLKLHEHIKSNYEHLRSSDIFQKSFQLFNNIYIQMQYVKQAAVINKFPKLINANIILVNYFYASIDNGQPIRYKVFCLDNSVIFTTSNPNVPAKVEIYIKNDTISLNASTRDDLCFEMYEHLEKHQKKTYMLVSENTYVRNEWMDTLQRMLYNQMVIVKQRVQSTSDESTSSF